MKKTLFTIVVALSCVHAEADILHGFTLEEMAVTSGFLTSIAFDREARLHYTTMDGGIFALVEGGTSVEIARVDSANEGNAALLGMAFDHDGSIIVHYVSSDLVADLVSRLDPVSGDETILARFQCSPGGEPCPTEHHGGNPVVAPDGSVFVGIGDYGLLHIAQRDDVHAAKIYRIAPDGAQEVWAKGLRNPFDLAWDGRYGRLIATDNGAGSNDDEVIFVRRGDNHGWPLTMGGMPPVEGMTPPVYVFPDRVAPTGLTLPAAESGWFRKGVLVAGFVTRALYYFPDYDEAGIEGPVTILRRETMPLIDVWQGRDGEIYLASGFSIYRLAGPAPGDVDGDGEISRRDWLALVEELADSPGGRTERAHEGSFAATWGADVNQDGVIDARDLAELSRLLASRKRGAGRPAPSGRRRPVGRVGH